jgi:hypothetical protein
MTPRLTITATLTVLIVGACGGSATRHAAAGRTGCMPAPIHRGPPPRWTATVWADSSPGFSIPYALASGDAAAAFFFSHPLRPGRSTTEANKILWVVRYPRNGQPLTVSAAQPGAGMRPVRAQWSANAEPGEIYPSALAVPRPGCWRLTLAWAGHRAAIDVAVVAAPRPLTPAPLHGIGLGRHTGLRLLVSAEPPFLVDVDSGQITPIVGVPVNDQPVLSVQQVGRDAVMSVDARSAHAMPRIYVVRHGSTRARVVGTALQAAPAQGGHGLWLLSQLAPRRCGLSEVTLAGAAVHRSTVVPCSSQLVASGGVGAVLVDGRRVIDPGTGRTQLRASTVWTVAGRRALLSRGSGPPLRLATLGTDRDQALRWPTRVGGTDEADAGPAGRAIALDFGDPAYRGSGTQIMDAWLLDPGSGRFRHLPGMPAAVLLKATSMAWAPDGRLVILASLPSGRTVVAVWRPGQPQLGVRAVRLPDRMSSGSDSFAVW